MWYIIGAVSIILCLAFYGLLKNSSAISRQEEAEEQKKKEK